jgi:hypothetical protein
MLEDIKKQYDIDYKVDPRINRFYTGSLLNQAYKDSNADLFIKISQKSDFKEIFIQHFENTYSEPLSELNYDLLILTFEIFKKYQMPLSDEKLLNAMTSNGDYRAKLFIAEKIINENKSELNLSKEQTIVLIQEAFKNFDWKINIDLFLHIPHFKSNLEKYTLSLIDLAFDANSKNTNISQTHLIVEKLNNLGYTIEKTKAPNLIEQYLNYYKKEDNTFNAFFNMGDFIKLLNVIQKNNQEVFLSSFLKDTMDKFLIKDENDKNKFNQALIEIEKNDLDFICQIKPLAMNQKIKI